MGRAYGPHTYALHISHIYGLSTWAICMVHAHKLSSDHKYVCGIETVAPQPHGDSLSRPSLRVVFHIRFEFYLTDAQIYQNILCRLNKRSSEKLEVLQDVIFTHVHRSHPSACPSVRPGREVETRSPPWNARFLSMQPPKVQRSVEQNNSTPQWMVRGVVRCFTTYMPWN